jgi:hypothetical protein
MFTTGTSLLGCSLFLLYTAMVYGQYTSTFSIYSTSLLTSMRGYRQMQVSTTKVMPLVLCPLDMYVRLPLPQLLPVSAVMEFLDWMIAVRVDSTAYLLQGDNRATYVPAKTIGGYLTSTRTILTMDAGPVRVNITYLTPIEVRFSFCRP